MRTFIALLLVAAAAPALAQVDPPSPGQIQFIEGETLFVEGQVVRPPGLFIDKDVRPEHRNLVQLRHQVLPKLKQTAKDASLR